MELISNGSFVYSKSLGVMLSGSGVLEVKWGCSSISMCKGIERGSLFQSER
jgi:hypothetical protein